MVKEGKHVLKKFKRQRGFLINIFHCPVPLNVVLPFFATAEHLLVLKNIRNQTQVKAHPPNHAKLHSKAVIWGSHFGKHPLRNTVLPLLSTNVLHDLPGPVQVLAKSFKYIKEVVWEKERGLSNSKFCI